MEERIALAMCLQRVLERRDLSSSAKLAYMVLVANHGHRVSPVELAWAIGVSDRVWENAVSALIRERLVEPVGRSHGKPASYRVVLPEVIDE